MTLKEFWSGTVALLIAVTVIVNPLSAQSGKEPGNLYNEISHMDSVLFSAFNAQNLSKIRTLFTEDLEFYHDKAGLMNYQKNLESTKNLFATNTTLRRELIQGSLEVYPIKDYGAIQTGSHRFCHTEDGSQDCGTFRFMHIWKKVNNEWKLARVISYDH